MTKTQMPEPVAEINLCGYDASVVRIYPEYDLEHVDIGKKLITTDQAEAYAEARVREALEMAAQACDSRIGKCAPGMHPHDVADCDQEAKDCADAIRALIPQENKS